MTGKHGFSGSRPPSAQPLSAPPPAARRHIRLGPPANDNVRLGGLRFTGLRLAFGVLVVALAFGALRGLGLL